MAVGSEAVPFDAARRWPRAFPTALDRLLPPRDRDLTLLWRALGTVVVSACCVVVLVALHPSLLLRDTTPNGGDLGAHVWFPAFLRDHLLPNWRVAGWSNDWFGGFPAGQFYFPVPALVTVALDVVLPYNVALKLTTAIGPVLMPAGAYAFARGIRLRRPGPELCAVATVCFLFFKGIATTAAAGTDRANIQFNQRIMGGTLVSSLAGEYSFAFALTLALFALGALAFSLRTGRRKALTAVLLAATVMSHVVVGIFVVVGAAVIVLVALTQRLHRTRRVLAVAVAVGGVAALLTAFWSLPLVATFGYTANMRYTKIDQYLDYLIVDEFLWAYLLALIGVALGIAFRNRPTLIVAIITAFFAAVFRYWPELHAWNLRFLPFWYLGVFLLAAIGASEIVRRLSDQFGRVWVGPPAPPDAQFADDGPADVEASRSYRVVTSATIATVVVILTVVGIWFNQSHEGFISYWATWNETGYEHPAPVGDVNWKSQGYKQYGEYKAIVDRMGALPPGRALWEGGASIDNYGTSLAMMLLPYWTHGRIQSFEGLYYESAASTPYDFMTIAMLSAAGNASNPVRGLDYLSIANFSDGVRYLRALGGRYYLAHSQAAKDAANKDPGLRFIASTPDVDHQPPEGWSIYEVRDHALVAPLRSEPVVVGTRTGNQQDCFGDPKAQPPGPELGPWECVAAGWWSKPGNLDRPLAESGPAGWPRARAQDAARVPRRPLPAVRVTRIHQSDDDIRFHVSRPGVPVVVRTSYYPNWEASGARGPWRLTPNLMVVVPTGHDVTLHYARSGPERLGGLLSAVGLVGLGALVVADVRRRRELKNLVNAANAAN
ncbi:MAG: hypothetical protein ACXVK4_02575 [Acidimicrobiia bacterium]